MKELDLKLKHKNSNFMHVSPPPISSFMVLLVALIISFFYAWKILDEEGGNFEELALEDQVSSIYGDFEGVPVHCKGVLDSKLCINGIQNRNTKSSYLWLGNSQLHSINQYQPGEETAPLILFRLLQDKGKNLVAFSQPNANFMEHYIIFEYLLGKIKIEKLILPLVFDDTRETGVRESIFPALEESPTVQSLQTTKIGEEIYRKFYSKNPLVLGNINNGGSLQEGSELGINNWLNSKFSWWDNRAEYRSRVFVLLYKASNFAFVITPQTKRRVIKSRYRENLDALEAILKSAHRENISVFAYIAPLRNDAEIPYDTQEYIEFKKVVEWMVRERGGKFSNFEELVPTEDWGEKGSTRIGGDKELDFMHFQAKGHEVLANKVFKLLSSNE